MRSAQQMAQELQVIAGLYLIIHTFIGNTVVASYTHSKTSGYETSSSKLRFSVILG